MPSYSGMDCCEIATVEERHPRRVQNRRPTPQDLLELSSKVYKSRNKLYAEADSQGMRVYHDELIVGDVRLVMLVPSWFPKAHVTFDWQRVQGDRVSVVFVLRGTMQDLVGNTKANLQLIYNKLVDDQHLPDTATDATKVIQAWLLTLLRRHPQLDAANMDATSFDFFAQQQQQRQQEDAGEMSSGRLHLDVHITGHSLGGLLSEVATVESAGFAARHGAEWHCTSFESPGLPDLYYDSALRIAPKDQWDDVIMSYLAAPNVINMLYRHLGCITHVVVPWEHTWTFMAKCVGADVARVTAWAIVGSMVVAGASQVAGVARRRTEDELTERAGTAATNLTLQQCDAVMPHLTRASASAPAALGAASASAPAVLGAAEGPALPQFLLVAATPSSASDTAAAAAAAASGRRLLSMAVPPPGTGAAVASVAGTAASSAGGQQAANIASTAVAAVAAAGEAAASIGGGRILQGVLRRSGLGTLAAVLGGWVFGRGGIWGVMECLAGVLGVEVEELICQHALGPMRQCFDPHTGELKARYCRNMASWPHLGTRGKVIVTAAKQVAKWTLPSFICRDNLGVANIMSRTAMVEARCARLQGYQVLEDTAEARQALGLDAAGFAGPSDMYMPLVDGEPVSPMALEQQQQQAELAFERQQHHRPALPAPRGLGLGLARHVHSSRHSHLLLQQQQQQEEEGAQMLPSLEIVGATGDGMSAEADVEASPSAADDGAAGAGATAAAAAGSSGRQLYDLDDPAAMAVDSAEAAADGMFEDAITVGPDDLVCEGLPFEPGASFGTAAGPTAAVAGSPMGGAGFIYLRGMGIGGVGGAFEPVSVPRVGGGSAAASEDDDVHMQAGPGLMQLQFNG